MPQSEKLREKNLELSISAEVHIAAEDIATHSQGAYQNEDDKQNLDIKLDKNVFGVNKTIKKNENKNKTINKNKNKNVKDKKIKEAAKIESKSARKITEYWKPKPEHPSTPQNVTNIEPGAAVAGIPAFKPGSGNTLFSGKNRKPDLTVQNPGKTLSLPRGLNSADCDWPDGTIGPRLSQSE